MNNASGISKLSYSEIEEIAENLNSSSRNMETLLNEIKNLFEKVGTDEVWSGTAAATSKETFDRLSEKFPQFSQAISNCHSKLMTVIANFKAVDNAVMGRE